MIASRCFRPAAGNRKNPPAAGDAGKGRPSKPLPAERVFSSRRQAKEKTCRRRRREGCPSNPPSEPSITIFAAAARRPAARGAMRLRVRCTLHPGVVGPGLPLRRTSRIASGRSPLHAFFPIAQAPLLGPVAVVRFPRELASPAQPGPLAGRRGRCLAYPRRRISQPNTRASRADRSAAGPWLGEDRAVAAHPPRSRPEQLFAFSLDCLACISTAYKKTITASAIAASASQAAMQAFR